MGRSKDARNRRGPASLATLGFSLLIVCIGPYSYGLKCVATCGCFFHIALFFGYVVCSDNIFMGGDRHG